MGPTASGKTELAIEVAEALDLAVLSVDSRQLYRQMDVGTAKPTPQQRRRVRHELLDLRSPDQPITLQEFTALAGEAIAAEHRRRGVALLVGGTGLYLKALLQGLQPPAVPPQQALRDQFSALGQAHCHRLLCQIDPVAGARIQPADAVRTQRALEVIYATGRSLTGQQRRSPPPWRVVELGLDPPDLTERIRRRTIRLYREGLLAETAQLIQRYGRDCPLLETIGYGEARSVLAGELDEQQALAITERRTRQYAKRQRTWFRRQHRPLWLTGEGGAIPPSAPPPGEAMLGRDPWRSAVPSAAIWHPMAAGAADAESCATGATLGEASAAGPIRRTAWEAPPSEAFVLAEAAPQDTGFSGIVFPDTVFPETVLPQEAFEDPLLEGALLGRTVLGGTAIGGSVGMAGSGREATMQARPGPLGRDQAMRQDPEAEATSTQAGERRTGTGPADVDLLREAVLQALHGLV